jgi:hypothetical protein
MSVSKLSGTGWVKIDCVFLCGTCDGVRAQDFGRSDSPNRHILAPLQHPCRQMPEPPLSSQAARPLRTEDKFTKEQRGSKIVTMCKSPNSSRAVSRSCNRGMMPDTLLGMDRRPGLKNAVGCNWSSRFAFSLSQRWPCLPPSGFFGVSCSMEIILFLSRIKKWTLESPVSHSACKASEAVLKQCVRGTSCVWSIVLLLTRVCKVTYILRSKNTYKKPPRGITVRAFAGISPCLLLGCCASS